MSFRRVLFLGLGGAGQRHLRLFRKLLPQAEFLGCRRTGATPLLNPDFSVAAQGDLQSAYGLHLLPNADSAFARRPDLTVISTPTACHRQPMLSALAAGSGVFVEKPWAESLDDFAAFRDGMRHAGLPFQISFQRRHHPLIAQARQALQAGKIGKMTAAQFLVHSYVPAWHAYEDWRGLYAVRKDLGGGVLLTEIHEIDLAYWFFGLPQAVFCTGGNRGGEVLDVEDTVQMTLLYSDFSVQITLCFMHKTPARHFHLAGTEGDIHWNADGNRLTVNGETQSDPAFPNDAMFEAQARNFVQDWNNAASAEALDTAGASLAIVQAARRSMVEGCAVAVTQP